ncbi:thermonuclease family protein [Pseudorhodoferax sp. Leaf267]|uniref:thermonuclease family protein n=1 Tax=Pseudorhodoferax sp. Leaf267 TaxID=1736316 RepID=UPI00350FE5A2
MVRLGMAWWYRAYAREQRPEARGQYESAEHEARAKRVGLWHDPDPMTPWDWRVANRRGGGHQIDGPTPVLQPNTRMILRSNSAVDAEWCRRILWHEGFVFEAMKGRRSATMYLRVLLGY